MWGDDNDEFTGFPDRVVRNAFHNDDFTGIGRHLVSLGLRSRPSSCDHGASAVDSLPGRARHLTYAVGWKKLEPVWDLAIRARRLTQARPLLERVLAGQSL